MAETPEMTRSKEMERPVTLSRPAPGDTQSALRGPAWLALIVLGSVAASILSEDWIAGVGIWVLWAGWRYLRRETGSSVLAMACTFQWCRITAGIYDYALTRYR